MISATVICDSISEAGVRLTTFEIEVPRIVWSEFMTHRMFSRNASSSRAIPFNKMVDNLDGIPVRFGKNISGMKDGGEHSQLINDLYTPEEWWHLAKLSAKAFSQGYADAGYHKQVSGRLTETFQCIKAVVSATEFSNFFWLRNDSAADPTIERLAQEMWVAYNSSTPQLLKAGEWHLPYVFSFISGNRVYGDVEVVGGRDEYFTEYSLEDAIKVSCARCCAVSFRNTDYGLEKSLEVYERLISESKIHGSALEHCATPMAAEYNPRTTMSTIALNVPHCSETWQNGVSHMDKDGQLWSGNMKGWIQHRKTIVGENYASSNM